MAKFDPNWTQFYEPKNSVPYEILPSPERYLDPKARERTLQPPRSHKTFVVFAILVILSFAAGMALIILTNPNGHY